VSNGLFSPLPQTDAFGPEPDPDNLHEAAQFAIDSPVEGAAVPCSSRREANVCYVPRSGPHLRANLKNSSTLGHFIGGVPPLS
jgi:hypothetical protein